MPICGFYTQQQVQDRGAKAGDGRDWHACKPVPVRGCRVYPPDETAAVFVSAPQKACSVKNRGVGQVQPIAAGAGT
jgi:hypothetical protein